ncbi:MAG TPA: Crp/Fnr family transcriptional regulator [Puia sp.]|jgi:CRP-like cAMP-binding protein
MEQQILSLEDLITYLCSLHPFSLPDDLKERLRKIVKVKTIKKKEHLLSGGETCRHIYFIKRGLLRCYYYNENDEEVTGWVFGEKKTVVGVQSFYTQNPGFEYIHALEETEVFYISHDELTALYLEFPVFCFVAVRLTAEYLIFWFSQLCNLRRHDAQKRFDLMMNSDEAALFNAVPLKYLASYLNVSAETLSRLRSNS